MYLIHELWIHQVFYYVAATTRLKISLFLLKESLINIEEQLSLDKKSEKNMIASYVSFPFRENLLAITNLVFNIPPSVVSWLKWVEKCWENDPEVNTCSEKKLSKNKLDTAH